MKGEDFRPPDRLPSMPRYLVMNRRSADTHAVSARDAVAGQPGISIVTDANPELITIEASDDAATRLRQRIGRTHHVELEVRRGLQ